MKAAAEDRAMMGERQVAQDSLFYEFRLEEHVPASHLLRSIDRFVDLTGLRAYLSGFYSSTGRPSVDPELMIRMLIVGYCYGIRSERRGSSSQSGLSLVLPAGSGGRSSGPLDVLEEPAWPLRGERPFPTPVRGCGGALHRRGSGRG
jgi:hypothetical protein